MRGDERFDGLAAFVAVARDRSFRRAAKDLGVTPGAVSQAIRALERRLGTRLFLRTTRSVALTEAGQAMLARVGPILEMVDGALDAVQAMRGPTGLLRISVPRLAVPLFVRPVLATFRRRHPGVAVEVSVDDAFVDLQAGGFDAGIRLGESIAKDMVAVRLSAAIRWCVVGAPGYFAKHGHPEKPRDLVDHAIINYRRAGTNEIYRWELEHRGRTTTVDVPGRLIVNDGQLGLDLARQGLGLLYTADIYITADLAARRLVTTLDAYRATSPGFFLYFARGAAEQPKLRAFVDTMTELVRDRR